MVEDEEKLQLRVDIERLRRQIRQKDEMIEEMESELSREKTFIANDKAEIRERELNGQIRGLQIEIDGKDGTISQKDGVIDELRVEIEKLRESNRELANRSDYPESDESSSFLETEMMRISDELQKFKETTSSLLEKNLEYEKECLQLKSDYESAIDHVNSLESHLKTREEEISRLESEVFDLKCSAHGKIANAGNSIFAEAMDAEQKLEEDLKRVYHEKQYLMERLKRIQLEKEEAEERAQANLRRNCTVRTAVSHVDIEEMRRLRARVHELEVERTCLWERLFIKMRTVPKREMGGLFAGYLESFKCSIASVKYGQEELLKKNEQFVTTIRRLQQENEEQRSKMEQMQFDIESLQRYKDQFSTTDAPIPKVVEKFNVPLKPMNDGRWTFFTKRKPEEKSISTNMMAMSITPQKPASLKTLFTDTKENTTSEYSERQQRIKAERKQAATPASRYNFVQLAVPSTVPKFKPPTLNMPSTPGPDS